MRILGVDTSLTATGLALIDIATWPPSNPPRQPGEPVSYSAQVVTVGAPKPTKDKTKQAMARRVRTLLSDIEEVFKEDRPEHVGMEALAYGARGEGAWVLPWIFGEVISLTVEYSVPLTVVATKARAKFATGNGNADKQTVLLAVNKLEPEAEVSNDNEADAMSVGAVVCQKLGLPIWPVTAYRTDVVSKLGD
ncbi:RuvC [Mycobacterium phage Hosp]|uniref:RuvC-like Holliday junction resolvase n=1 Tax=Mycobacterium phage 39HC TaxID=1463809 RepID=UPI0003F1D6AA|nr:RuvC-like Holliday junction resolvase [Mycobacterium phage 39HC]YP_009032229.1 RuvC-like Holliday junction resolvase [Mycobacterium phage Hosp]AHJ88305.1 RuvC [Mycobacterium phage 39HC]AHJ88405.1 RuvC [Mycobacterium phage 40BC]AHK11957.1 RuvC [Mycobacterium phage Hosp]